MMSSVRAWNYCACGLLLAGLRAVAGGPTAGAASDLLSTGTVGVTQVQSTQPSKPKATKDPLPVTLELIAPPAIVAGHPIRFLFCLCNTGEQPVTVNTFQEAYADPRAARAFVVWANEIKDGVVQHVPTYRSSMPQHPKERSRMQVTDMDWRPDRPPAGALRELQPRQCVDGEFTLTPVAPGEYQVMINNIPDPGLTAKLPAGKYLFSLRYDDERRGYAGNGAHVGIANYYFHYANANPVVVEIK
jgi:hypothetical protein